MYNLPMLLQSFSNECACVCVWGGGGGGEGEGVSYSAKVCCLAYLPEVTAGLPIISHASLCLFDLTSYHRDF